jgi:hypothetical protein
MQMGQQRQTLTHMEKNLGDRTERCTQNLVEKIRLSGVNFLPPYVPLDAMRIDDSD